MAKDGWEASTQTNLKHAVSPQANKSFGPGMDMKEAIQASTKTHGGNLSQAGQPAKGSNDIAHAGTSANLKGAKPVKGNRPEAWPGSFQKV